MINERRQRTIYVVADFLSTNLAVLLFNIVRYYDLPSAYTNFNSLSQFLSAPIPLIGQIIFPLLMMCLYYMSGYYSTVYVKSRASELATTISTAFIGTLMVFFGILLNDLTNDRTHDYTLFLMLFGLLFAVVYIPRLIITWRTTRRIAAGIIGLPTAIVARSSSPEAIEAILTKISPTTAMRPVVVLDADNRADAFPSIANLPVRNLDDAPTVCPHMKIQRIVATVDPAGWQHTLPVINRLFGLDTPILMAAGGLPSYLFRTRLINLTAEPFIDITRSHLPESTLKIKRVIDVAVSSLMLAIVAVPILLLAAAVKIDSHGPAFYRQRRVGMRGRYFNIIKLRTMSTQAEADGRPQLSTDGDPRITRLGRVLRKYRLDELPQFFNVLRGDMSLVGPRPERPYFTKLLAEREPGYVLIQRVRPGITSLGMVKFGYASTIDQMVERLRYDLLYLENISITTDMKILLYTAHTVLTGKGV